MKTCSQCSFEKELDQFYVFSKSKDGRAQECKKCKNSRSKKYRSSSHGKRMDADRQKQWAKNNPKSIMLKSAKLRASKLNIPCTITLDDIEIPKRCPVLGIELIHGDGGILDASPSLDRILPSQGYVPGNICVISNRANRIKNDASLADLLKLTKWLQNQCKSTQD